MSLDRRIAISRANSTGYSRICMLLYLKKKFRQNIIYTFLIFSFQMSKASTNTGKQRWNKLVKQTVQKIFFLHRNIISFFTLGILEGE